MTVQATIARGEVRCDYPPGDWYLEVVLTPLIDGHGWTEIALPEVPLTVDATGLVAGRELGRLESRYCGMARRPVGRGLATALTPSPGTLGQRRSRSRRASTAVQRSMTTGSPAACAIAAASQLTMPCWSQSAPGTRRRPPRARRPGTPPGGGRRPPGRSARWRPWPLPGSGSSGRRCTSSA